MLITDEYFADFVLFMPIEGKGVGTVTAWALAASRGRIAEAVLTWAPSLVLLRLDQLLQISVYNRGWEQRLNLMKDEDCLARSIQSGVL